MEMTMRVVTARSALAGGSALAMLASMPAHAAVDPAEEPVAATEEASAAQQNPPLDASQAAQEASGGIEEIIVTAQRRAERLQDVPIAITALSSDAAEQLGVTNSEALNISTPGLHVARGANASTTFLRGVGSLNQVIGAESSIAYYVDGVYIQSLIGTTLEFNNIERVEVLRGPQGTLFGRNATGGVIQIITRRPSHETQVEGQVGYGNYDTFDASLYATGGVAPNLAADFALKYSDRAGGFGINLVNGHEVYTSRYFGGRTKILWEPGASTEVTFAADYNYSRDQDAAAMRLPQGSIGLDGTGFPGFYNVNETQDSFSRTRQWGGSLTINHDFGGVRFVSISGYRDVEGYWDLDQDRVPIPAIRLISTQISKTFSQELQLQSDEGSPLTWILGAYYLNDKSGYEPLRVNLTQRVTRSAMYTDSYAVFGQATVPLLDSTNFTAGLRYTSDRRRIRGVIEAPEGTVVTDVEQAQTFNKLTWRLSLDHKFTPDILAYASYNRGFRSGLYGTSAPAAPAVRPEVIDAYEIGLKTEFLDRRVRFNVSGFYYDFKDLQFQVVNAGASVLFNAASSKIKGAEFELVAIPVPGLTLQGSLSLLDGEYTRFPGAIIFEPVAGGGNRQVVIDASGFKTIQTPPVTATLSASYDARLGDGTLTFSANYYYNDGFNWIIDPRLREGSYDLVNGTIKYTAPDDRFSIALWGRNLLNEKYSNYTNSNAQADQESPAAPRTYGVRFGFKF